VRRPRQGQDSWVHTVVPITLGFVTLFVLIWLYLDFTHADW